MSLNSSLGILSSTPELESDSYQACVAPLFSIDLFFPKIGEDDLLFASLLLSPGDADGFDELPIPVF